MGLDAHPRGPQTAIAASESLRQEASAVAINFLPTTRLSCSRALVSMKGIWPPLTVSILA